MKLTFKNKIQMAFRTMCEEGSKKGGIPKQITIDVDEAGTLIREIKSLRAEQDNVTAIQLLPLSPPKDLNDPEHPIYLIRMVWDAETSELLDVTTKAFLNFWMSGKILVSYNHDQLRVPVILEKHTKPGTTDWVG